MLTLVRDQRIVPVLRAVLATPDEEDGVRGEAVGYLAILNDTASVPVIRDLLRASGTLPSVAARALARIDSPEARHAIRERLADESISKILRLELVVAAGRQHDIDAIALILAFAEKERDRIFQSAAATALGRIGTIEAARLAEEIIVQRLPQPDYDCSRRWTASEVILGLTAARKNNRNPADRREIDAIIRRLLPLSSACG